MTLTELKYIVAVARTKHFGKAADECFVSQPTLSVGIRKLEDSLGVAIFERGRSEVKITPIGQEIINQAQNVLAETEVIKDIVLANKNQLKDQVKFASTYTIGKYLFGDLIKQLYAIASDLPVFLKQDYHNSLLSKLLDRELDIILLSTNIFYNNNYSQGILNNNLSDDLCIEPILSEDLYLLVANSNQYSHAKAISLKELNFAKVAVLNTRHCLTEQTFLLHTDYFRNANHYNQNNLDSLEAIHDFVIANSGFAIVPALYCNELNLADGSPVKIIPFTEPKPKRVLSLVWRNDFFRTQVIDVFKSALQNVLIPGLEVIDLKNNPIANRQGNNKYVKELKD